MLKKKIKLADNQHCTACRACLQVCPKKCISLEYDEYDSLHAVINDEKCIKCGSCQKVCHLVKNVFYDKSDEVYVAWSIDDLRRNFSASGGIATELYLYALNTSMHCYGVAFDISEGVYFRELTDNNEIIQARNSKYVYSSTEDCYSKIKRQLRDNENVLFIGLPCQVAGLKSYLGNYNNEKLLTVDIVCHGTCPFEYLKQHISRIEKRRKKKADIVEFRNPEYGTEKYRFTIKNNNTVFYNKGVYEDDLYQIGYHKSLIYREACFNCKYARPERVGDLTIADFSGLGRIGGWKKRRDSVSMIIVSSTKGKKLLNNLLEQDKIYAELRPSDEAFMFEHQLQHPSIPHHNRQLFLTEYQRTQSFEHSASIALADDVRKNRVKMLFYIENMRPLFAKMILKRIKNMFKRN